MAVNDKTLLETTDEELQALKQQARRAKVIRSTPNIKTKETQKQICELRLQGYSWPEIGEKMGMKPAHAHEQHRRALAAIIREPAMEVREMEIRRLDALLRDLHDDYRKFFPVVNAGQVVRDVLEDENGDPILQEDGRMKTYKLEDIGPRLQILDRMLKIQERRAKLLGLDAPVRRTLEGADGGPVKFDHNSLRGLTEAELTAFIALMEKAAGSDSTEPAEGS